MEQITADELRILADQLSKLAEDLDAALSEALALANRVAAGETLAANALAESLRMGKALVAVHRAVRGAGARCLPLFTHADHGVN